MIWSASRSAANSNWRDSDRVPSPAIASRLLASTKKSGCLRLTGSRGDGSVWVDSGTIVASVASGAPHATSAVEVFFELREMPGLKKKPSTSELLDWLKLLLAEDIPPEALRAPSGHQASIPPLYGALLKNEQDVHLFEQLLFMQRRGR